MGREHSASGLPAGVSTVAPLRRCWPQLAAPCGAPAFAAVLTWVSGTQSALWGFIYLFVFSLGMTALLVAIGLSAGSLAALPRAGQWMAAVKKVAGLVMLAMGAFYFFKMGTVW